MPAANQGTGQNVGYPDTCDTPTSSVNVPIPYPNLGQDTLSSSFSATVFVSLLPAHNQSAAPSMTNGDNAGVAQSTGNMGSGGCTAGNPIVHISGQPAEHMCTTSQGNRYNNSLGSKLIPSLTNVFISSAGLSPAPSLSWSDARALLRELEDEPDEAAPGITWAPTPGGARVLHVRRGGLGARLGLRRGDRILSWNGAREPGPARPGARVAARVQRGGAVLAREAVQPRPRGAVLAARRGELGRIAVRCFSRGAPGLVREAWSRLRWRGAARLELDLRGCPGGLLSAAAGVAGLFLPAGSTLVDLSLGGARRTVPVPAGQAPLPTPLRVRVDAHTASAAEVLAAALRDQGRAAVRGGPTWGKRHVEWLVGAPGSSHARLVCPLYSPASRRRSPA